MGDMDILSLIIGAIAGLQSKANRGKNTTNAKNSHPKSISEKVGVWKRRRGVAEGETKVVYQPFDGLWRWGG